MKRLPLAVVLWLALQPLPLSAHPSAQHRIETLSEAIRAKPDEQELYLRRGQAYSNEGQLQPALADLRKAEQLGDPVLAAFDLGVVHYQLGDLQAARMLEGLESGGVAAALDMLDQGIESLGAIPQLQRPAIELERKRGNLAAAITRLESLKSSLGDSPDWNVDMGELLLRAGRRDDAASSWTKRPIDSLSGVRPSLAGR